MLSVKLRKKVKIFREAMKDLHLYRNLRFIINELQYRRGVTYVSPPHSIYISVNSACNANCLMCDIGLKNKESNFFQILNKNSNLDIEKLKDLINQVKFFKPRIVFAMTEPLLYPYIVEAVETATQAGLKSIILSNGLLLSKYANMLCDVGVHTIRLSIDGTREIHNKIRGVPYLFEKMLEGINILLNRADRPKILINTVITPLNAHNLYELAEFISSLGIDHVIVHMNFINHEMKAIHNELWKEEYPATESSISAIKPADMDLNILQNQLLKIRKKLKKVTFGPPIFTKNELKTYYMSGYFIRGLDHCKLPWHSCTICANGDVVTHATCFNIPFGNIYDTPFTQIWNSKKIRRFRKYLLKYKAFPACSRCCGVFHSI